MTGKKLIGYGMVSVVVVGLVASIAYLYLTRGVYVRVTNNTQNALQDVDITYTGGAIRIATLKPKTSYGRRINPAGESHLELAWLDSSGTKRSHTVNVYFEHGYRGSIKIVVESDNRISVTDKIRILPF